MALRQIWWSLLCNCNAETTLLPAGLEYRRRRENAPIFEDIQDSLPGRSGMELPHPCGPCSFFNWNLLRAEPTKLTLTVHREPHVDFEASHGVNLAWKSRDSPCRNLNISNLDPPPPAPTAVRIPVSHPSAGIDKSSQYGRETSIEVADKIPPICWSNHRATDASADRSAPSRDNH